MKISVFDRPASFGDLCTSDAGRRMLRGFFGALALAVLISLLFAALGRDVAYGQTVARPTLRSTVAIADAIVTVGDFFEDAGDKAATPLFRAPDLGTTGPVSARRVVDLARSAGLVGADTGGLIEVQVTRLSRQVEADDLARLVAIETLRQNGRNMGETTVEDLRVAFDGAVDPRHADLRAANPVRLVSFSYNQQNGRFDALFQVDQGGSNERLHLRGEVIETVQVVSLARALARGEIVSRDDVVVDRQPRRLAGGVRAADPDQIVGMAARRAIRAGQPVAGADFTRPQVVVRGDTVVVVYETAGLSVSTRGQATESGALGELVTVFNPQSKRTLHATVVGPGKVAVTAAPKAVASIGRTTP